MTYPTLCFLSYNRPQFLKQAIETALEHAGEKVEIIVHDDGSTDRELLKYLYTIHQKGIVSSVILNAPGVNQGQGVALNRMFRMATGDPIIKLDHDLIFKPDWLLRCRAILQDPRVGLLGLFKYHHEPVNWQTTIITDPVLMEMGYSHHGLPRGYSFHTHICGSGMVIPRRVWERLGPFPERWESFGEDWEFQKRVAATPGMFNALPDEDLVENVGFGVGPSTVVVANQETGAPEPSKIHKLPMLVPSDV
jgi:glycosyltransferase involved in cell wall biosynthesis